ENMRGHDEQQGGMFSYISAEKRVPQDHPLRGIRRMTDAALQTMSPLFAQLYSRIGRPSIAPEKLLRALLLQAFYSVRSERLLMEQLDYNLLFRWFVGMNVDDAVWDVTVFTKNRNGLVVQACVTPAGRKAEREAAEAMVTPVAGKQNNKRQSGETLAALTLAADKSYQAEEFINRLRELQVVPHIAEYEKETALSKNWLLPKEREDPRFVISQGKRKLVEMIFGWMKSSAGLRKTKLRGRRRVDWQFRLYAAAA